MPRKYENQAGVALNHLSLDLPSSIYRELRIAAAEENTTLAKFVRKLLTEFYENRQLAKQPVQEYADSIPESTDVRWPGEPVQIEDPAPEIGPEEGGP